MFTVILLQIVVVSPGTHLVNKESKLNYHEMKLMWTADRRGSNQS